MKKTTFHSFFGGKNRFASYILPYIPDDFKTYIEPFSGSFAIYFLLDIPENCKDIIFNDINKDQVNLFACSKDHKKFNKILKDHLKDEDGLLYCNKKEFIDIKEFYKKKYYDLKKSNFRNDDFNIPDYDRATLYAFLLTSAFSSCSYTAAGYSGFNKEKMKLLSFIKKLENPYIQDKFSKITSIENLDFEDIIKKYDSPETFMYIDAPYFSPDKNGTDTAKRAGWYGVGDSFTYDSHMRLLKLLQTTKSKWMVSYYWFKELEEMLPKDKYFWRSREFFRSSASFSENKSQKGNELLIMNYDPDKINKGHEIKIIDEPVKEIKTTKLSSFWD